MTSRPAQRCTGPSVRLAPRLLGARLVSDVGGARVVVRLTEVEAYEGAADPASHAYRGRTDSHRGDVRPARAPLLLLHLRHALVRERRVRLGRHVPPPCCCEPARSSRASQTARARRPAARTERDLARGPARLATCLGLDAATNGVDLCSPDSPVQLDAVARRRPRGVVAGPRVGISVATERPWRFWFDGDPTVSVFKPGRATRQTL